MDDDGNPLSVEETPTQEASIIELSAGPKMKRTATYTNLIDSTKEDWLLQGAVRRFPPLASPAPSQPRPQPAPLIQLPVQLPIPGMSPGAGPESAICRPSVAPRVALRLGLRVASRRSRLSTSTRPTGTLCGMSFAWWK